MIPSKLAYLLYGAILGLHLPYLVIFCTAVGLTNSQAGFISGLRYGSAALAGPMWGYLADYTGRRKLIMAAISIGSAFPIFAMPWIARSIHPNPNMNCTFLQETNFTTPVTCNEVEREKQVTILFYVILAITMFGSVFVMSMPGYVDSIVIHVAKTGKKEAGFGAQRIFGSIGFTIANFLGGVAADAYNYPGISHYTAVFLMYLPSCLLLIPVGCYLVGQASWEVDKDEVEANTVSDEDEMGIGKKVLMLFKRFDVSFFMATVFISGLGNSLFLSFSYSLVEHMHVTKTQQSLIVSAGSVSELAVFPLTSMIIKKIGTAPCITLGIFSYLIRFLSMSYAKVFWVAAMTNLLHCIGFALSWAAMMEHTHKIATPQISGTLFNIMCGMFYNFSAFFANMLGGVLFDKVGGKMLFRYVAALCGIWTVFLLIFYGWQHVQNKKVYISENSMQYNASQGNTGVTGVENPVRVKDDEAPGEKL